MTLRVLGVDPGLTRCGIGVVDVEPNRVARLVAYSVIRTPIDADAAIRLLAVSDGIEEALELYKPQAMAVERVFAQNNLRTVMGTAQASGIALAAAARRGIPVKTHTPSEVKAAITGYGSADKKQVAAMVARVLNLAEPPKPADAADAVAIAICHAWRSGGVAAPGLGADLTPAQKAWQAAERSTRR